MTTTELGVRDELAQRVRAILSGQGDVREAAMFGVLAFMVDGRMAVAASRDGSLLVRSKPADHDTLTARGAEPARMGNDTPMGKGWLRVPDVRIADDGELAFWVEVGLDARPTGK